MSNLYSDKTYHFYCMFCGKEFKSFSSRANNEDVCKAAGLNTTSTAIVHSQADDIGGVKADPWWMKPITGDGKSEKKNGKDSLGKSSTGATYYGDSTWTKHSHHQWVKIGKYQVLAMSLDKANGVEKEVDYQVVMAQSYLYAGSVLMNYESKFQRHQQERLIYVVWPDMGIIPSKDYEALLDYLERLLAGGKKIAVGCLGGHGRTGTILAGLIKRIEHLSADEAISSLRKRYCQSAVETKGQENMVTGGNNEDCLVD